MRTSEAPGGRSSASKSGRARFAAIAGALCASIALALLPIGAGAAPSARSAPGFDADANETATVPVRILDRHGPSWIEIEGPGARRTLVRAGAGGLIIDGTSRPSLDLGKGRFRLRGAGLDRRYAGHLQIFAEAGGIAVRLETPLERYVADVVAAESEPGTPAAALRALAIVVRTRAVGRPPHEGAFCDLAHCQILAGITDRPDAMEAAAATAGRVLLVDGVPAGALFHADCGGHTADPAELFRGADRSGARPVADPGCGDARWATVLPRAEVEAVAASMLGGHVALERLRWIRGAGGFVVAVVDPATGATAPGEAFARALDRSQGWGVVRSPRFSVHPGEEWVRIEGTGHGHGAGLCQRGAARLAQGGLGHEAILRRYFPLATIGVAKGPRVD